ERNVSGKTHVIKKYPYFGGYECGNKILELSDSALDEFIISSLYVKNQADAETKTVWFYLANTNTYSDGQNFYIKRLSYSQYSSSVDDFALYSKDNDAEAVKKLEYNGTDGLTCKVPLGYYPLPSFAYPKIVVYGNYLYLLYVGTEYTEVEEIVTGQDDAGQNIEERDLYFHDIYLRKFLINEDEKKLKEVASINKKVSELANVAFIDFEKKNSDYVEPYHSPVVSDLIISSDGQTLYALLNVRAWGESSDIRNYGGLLTMSSTVTTGADDTESHNLEFKNLYGWHNQSSYPLTNEKQYFYGPTKILAKKQDELYIADEGAYLAENPDEEDEWELVNKKRLVKVNLESFALTAEDTDVTFSTEIVDPTGCSYLAAY
ncbi:MAG: hypothetical protein K6E78_04525, partial [Treponema sp.]|nr:hypothetical protein [Treponema sp.]